jgi:ABC-type multidrug transport system fused ATPase/permease subunit
MGIRRDNYIRGCAGILANPHVSRDHRIVTEQSVRKSYAARAASLRAQADTLRKRMRTVSNVRLIYFLALVGALVMTERYPPVFMATLAIGIGLFVWLVRRHRAVRAQLRDYEDRARLCDIGIARIDRDWESLPVVIANASAPTHPYADDLDLFGAPALTQLFGPLRTLHGTRILRSWLERRAKVDRIAERQEAVRILTSASEFRESLAVAAHRIPRASQRRVHAFLEWTTRRGETASMPLIVLARGLPLLTLAMVIAATLRLIQPVWIYAPVFASILVLLFTLRRAYRAFHSAFTSEPAPLNYGRIFAIAEQSPAGAPVLDRIVRDLRGASASIKRLERIMYSSDARRSGIFAMILEVLFLWSPNVLIELERWRQRYGGAAAKWFDALGELEALTSLATLAHDHPEWTFAQVDPALRSIEARGLGHPMLRDGTRVPNDVHVGPPGSLLLITGSNMSGKSTLLRAIGVNTALAYAGAPVCATSFRLPKLRLYTSINVRDSLATGASLYMAQLSRLKDILEAARSADADEPCCYLLDEILSGTNSADRTTAVRAIVLELLQLNAIGALTTHDLGLAADPSIASHATPIHFSETIDSENASMSFDYRVRPGIVQSSNAIALMRLMGFRLG